MRRILFTNLAISMCAVFALPALAEPTDKVAKMLQQPDTPALGTLHNMEGASAAVRADWDSQVALAAKAFREDPSLINQFNLATGYQATGRAALAIPLYEDLVKRGQFSSVRAVYDVRKDGVRRDARFNLADEARRRLDIIASRPPAATEQAAN